MAIQGTGSGGGLGGRNDFTGDGGGGGGGGDGGGGGGGGDGGGGGILQWHVHAHPYIWWCLVMKSCWWPSFTIALSLSVC